MASALNLLVPDGWDCRDSGLTNGVTMKQLDTGARHADSFVRCTANELCDPHFRTTVVRRRPVVFKRPIGLQFHFSQFHGVVCRSSIDVVLLFSFGFCGVRRGVFWVGTKIVPASRYARKNQYLQRSQGQPNHKKASIQELSDYLASVLPNYDKERVYNSDLKKLFQWFNLLAEKGLLKEKEEEKKEVKAKKPAKKKEAAKEEKPKPKSAPKGKKGSTKKVIK